MLPPNSQNPEASGSQTGPPSQDSGGVADRSRSQMGLAPSQDSRTTVAQSPPASLLYLERGFWSQCLGSGRDFFFFFLFTCSR